jgi:hypothetical protein
MEKESKDQVQKIPREVKYSAKHVLISFVGSGILATIFLIITVIFLSEDASNLSFEEKADMGGRNIVRIVYSFGLLTALFFTVSIKFKKFRMSAYFLIIYWIAGTIISVALINGFNNQNQTDQYKTNGIQCTRKESYPMPLEFERALSLYSQRLHEAGLTTNSGFHNCIDIQYSDLRLTGNAGVMGAFLPQSSTPNDLRIYVDNVYRFNDDLLTAILLSHELTHASNFIWGEKNGSQKSCIDDEINAHQNELNFIRTLNQEERSSIFSRYLQNLKNNNPNAFSKNFFYSLYSLFQISSNANNVCNNKYKQNTNEWNNCRYETEKVGIKKYLIDSKYCD